MTRAKTLWSAGLIAALCVLSVPGGAERWSEEKARAWGESMPWLVGANYAPAYAINQLEFWQADTFDIEAIKRELGWAADLGFNSLRVYLHDLLWKQDSEGFLNRLDQFVDVADSYNIGVMFVLFDGVWDPFPLLGPQRPPRPHLHNSGWVQSPHITLLKDLDRHDELEPYVKGVVGHFRNDKRVHVWDLYNEADNPNIPAYAEHEPANKEDLAMALMEKAFAWAREVEPVQPLTVGIWRGDWSSPEAMGVFNRFILERSDVISFHSYSDADDTRQRVEQLLKLNRPMLCTEYMARPTGSTFQAILPIFKEHKIGAYNWGFVSGKSQTIYPWESWRRQFDGPPELWFHDIFHPDGTPYKEDEVEFIRGILKD